MEITAEFILAMTILIGATVLFALGKIDWGQWSSAVAIAVSLIGGGALGRWREQTALAKRP